MLQLPRRPLIGGQVKAEEQYTPASEIPAHRVKKKWLLKKASEEKIVSQAYDERLRSTLLCQIWTASTRRRTKR